MRPKCLICKDKTSISRGAIISSLDKEQGLVCPSCCRDRLNGMDFHIRDWRGR